MAARIGAKGCEYLLQPFPLTDSELAELPRTGIEDLDVLVRMEKKLDKLVTLMFTSEQEVLVADAEQRGDADAASRAMARAALRAAACVRGGVREAA